MSYKLDNEQKLEFLKRAHYALELYIKDLFSIYNEEPSDEFLFKTITSISNLSNSLNLFLELGNNDIMIAEDLKQTIAKKVNCDESVGKNIYNYLASKFPGIEQFKKAE